MLILRVFIIIKYSWHFWFSFLGKNWYFHLCFTCSIYCNKYAFCVFLNFLSSCIVCFVCRKKINVISHCKPIVCGFLLFLHRFLFSIVHVKHSLVSSLQNVFLLEHKKFSVFCKISFFTSLYRLIKNIIIYFLNFSPKFFGQNCIYRNFVSLSFRCSIQCVFPTVLSEWYWFGVLSIFSIILF